MTTHNQYQERFNERYRIGETPWDSGISPPELMEAVTGPAALKPGRMLDIGCGTGTNCLTLARLGWQTLGVDFAALAIQKATQKAQTLAKEIALAGGSAHFIQADVTQLAPPAPDKRYSLLLDLGCLNGIPHTLRDSYSQVVAQQAMPGALFLLYVHLPIPGSPDTRPLGATAKEIDLMFSSTFKLTQRVFGIAPQGGQSMWNWLSRLP